MTGKDSHNNFLSTTKSSKSEWTINIEGYIYNGQLVIIEEESSFLYTATYLNADNTTSEKIVEVDLDTGKQKSSILITNFSLQVQEDSLGGLVNENHEYVFIKSNMDSDLHVFNLESKSIETSEIKLPISTLNLPFFLFKESVIYPEYTTRCPNSSDQCYSLVSQNLKTEDVDWKTSFLVSDDCRASEYDIVCDSSGMIFVMSDSCDVRNNEIYKIQANDGKLAKIITIPGGTNSSATKVTVSNINENGLNNYYFVQKSEKDKKTYVFAMNKNNDELIWKEKISGTEFQSCSSPALSQDGTRMSLVCPGYVSSDLYVFNAKDGKKLLSKIMLSGFCLWTSTMNNGNIVVICDNLVLNNPKIHVYNEKGHELKKLEYKKMIFEQFPICDSSNNLYFCVTNYKNTQCHKMSF